MTQLAIMPQSVVGFAYGLLAFLHDALGSWGLSIIALTVAVRLVILPLTFKQVRGMQEMQRHAPELKKIQERYKDDTQRKNEETMKYYKEHSFNPLSSCLPLALQIPVFITLFDVLKANGPFARAIAEGHDPGFLFISNLAQKASPWYVLVVLMVLYVGTQLAASLISMVSAEGAQKRIMLFLPFVFVPVIISFPTGLIVYWITTNLWTVLQQIAVKRLMPAPVPAAARGTDGKGSEGPAGADAKVVAGSGNGAAAGSGAKGRAKAGAVAGGSNGAPGKAPPPSPRKKKKRSGRRR